MSLISLTKASLATAALGLGLALSGCGLDDIQLNGKLFEAAGLNNTGSVRKEAKVAERSPLVVPPGLDLLPAPGAAAPPEAAIVGVQDHDAKKQVNQAELERQQAAYCEIHYHRAKQHGDQNADLAEGPLGSCRGSVLSAIKKINEE
jgi:hypothetical protein